MTVRGGTVARVSDRVARPSELLRARLHARVDALGREALPARVREGDPGRQARVADRFAKPGEPLARHPHRSPRARAPIDLAYRWARSLRLRLLRSVSAGRGASGHWWIERDGLRLAVFGHVATEREMTAVRAALHREIDAPRQRIPRRIADGPVVVHGPAARTLADVLPLEAEVLDTLEALRWVARESPEGARTLDGSRAVVHDGVDDLHTTVFDVLERLLEERAAPMRTGKVIELLRHRLHAVRSLAERIVSGDERSMSGDALHRYGLESGYEELTLVVANLARLLESGTDGRDDTAASAPGEMIGAVGRDTVEAIEALSEPLRSRLRLAVGDIARIRHAGVRLEPLALRERLDVLGVRVAALLDYLAAHPDRAEPARRFVITHLHGLADALESAAPWAGDALAPLDLSRLARELDTLDGLLAEVLERLGREAQDALDVRLDVWAAQMRHERG